MCGVTCKVDSVCLCPNLLFLQGHHHVGLGPVLRPHLTLINSFPILSTYTVPFWVLGVRTSVGRSKGDPIQPITTVHGLELKKILCWIPQWDSITPVRRVLPLLHPEILLFSDRNPNSLNLVTINVLHSEARAKSILRHNFSIWGDF